MTQRKVSRPEFFCFPSIYVDTNTAIDTLVKPTGQLIFEFLVRNLEKSKDQLFRVDRI